MKLNLPWTVSVRENHVGTDNTVEILDCNGEVITSDEPYYPVAPDRELVPLIARSGEMYELILEVLRAHRLPARERNAIMEGVCCQMLILASEVGSGVVKKEDGTYGALRGMFSSVG